MQKVITVSLNGIAYQLDENAYAQLHAYLDAAARALAANPDSSEIVADLEQAIAEKCTRFLSPHKNVVKAAEIEQVLREMGPVDGEDAASGGSATGNDAAAGAGSSAADEGIPGATGDPGAAGPRTPGDSGTGGGAAASDRAAGVAPSGRRLYQISEGAILSGVCTGLAAYFAIDVIIVRAIFVALLFLTGGIALLGYVILMFIVPYASTSEEHAAARGLPFNARILVEGAKQKYAQFRQGAEWQGTRAEWRSEWRRMRAEWRAQRRRLRNEWRANSRFGSRPGGVAPPGAAVPITAGRYAAHVIGGSVIAVLSLVFALISIAWLFVLLSLLTTGAVLGFALPFGVPLWVTILILVLLYQLIAWPIGSMRRAAYYSMGGYHPGWVEAWNGIFAVALAVGVIWYGYHHVPELRAFFDHLTRWWHEATGTGSGAFT
jgi:phage shock protein PspC (stress-responsive transcriptional regulator)